MKRINYTPQPGAAFAWLPILTVTLRGPRGAQRFPMLVDSGSMETTVPAFVLRTLGVEPNDEPPVRTVAFNGTALDCRLADLEIQVGETRYRSRVAVIPDESRAFAVLGHRDFFLNFYVGFDSQSRSFYVAEPKKRLN